jgi:hypothetical protein
MNYGLGPGLNFLGRFLQLRFAHDVVAIENGIRLGRKFLALSFAVRRGENQGAAIPAIPLPYNKSIPGTAKIADRLSIPGKEKIFWLLPLAELRHKHPALFSQPHFASFAQAKPVDVHPETLLEQS